MSENLYKSRTADFWVVAELDTKIPQNKPPGETLSPQPQTLLIVIRVITVLIKIARIVILVPII